MRELKRRHTHLLSLIVNYYHSNRGSSAGGLAVFLNIDYIASKIKEKASHDTVVVGMPDGGFFLDLPSSHGYTLLC